MGKPSIITRIPNYLKQQSSKFAKVRAQIKDKNEYLKPGGFKMLTLGTKTILYRDSLVYGFLKNQAIDSSKVFPLTKLRGKLILSNLLTVKIPSFTGHDKQKYRGDLVLFTYYGDIKIFCFGDNVVLNFIDGIEKYNHLKSAHSNFSPFFNMAIQGFQDEQRLIIERYIDSQRNAVSDEWILKTFCVDLEKYLCSCVVNRQVTYTSPYEMLDSFRLVCKEDIIMRHLGDYLMNRRIGKWPQILCHGDFSFQNILFDGASYYIIDWEHCGRYLFFYDFFHCIITETLRQNNLLMFDYLNGRYDSSLKAIFQAVGFTYNKGDRLPYLLLSIIQGMSNRGYVECSMEHTRRLALVKTLLREYSTG